MSFASARGVDLQPDPLAKLMLTELHMPDMRRFAADLAAVGSLRVDLGEAADIIWATNAPELDDTA